MKALYNDGTVAELPEEEVTHVVRHSAAHIMRRPSNASIPRPTSPMVPRPTTAFTTMSIWATRKSARKTFPRLKPK